MPLNLTTAVDPGDLDNTTYSQVKIISMYHNPITSEINVICEYGNTVSDSWVRGVSQPRSYTISGSDYASLLAEMPDEGETVYLAAARVLYEWLVTKEYYAGTYAAP